MPTQLDSIGRVQNRQEVGLRRLAGVSAHQAFDGEGFFGERRELISFRAQIAKALGDADGAGYSLDRGDRPLGTSFALLALADAAPKK